MRSLRTKASPPPHPLPSEPVPSVFCAELNPELDPVPPSRTQVLMAPPPRPPQPTAPRLVPVPPVLTSSGSSAPPLGSTPQLPSLGASNLRLLPSSSFSPLDSAPQLRFPGSAPSVPPPYETPPHSSGTLPGRAPRVPPPDPSPCQAPPRELLPSVWPSNLL